MPSFKRQSALTLTLALGLSSWSAQVAAQAAPDAARSPQYYAIQGSAVAGLMGGALAVHLMVHPDLPGHDFSWFPGDRRIRGQRSLAATNLSNYAVQLAIAEPLFLQIGRGVDVHFANFGLVYGEAVSVNLLLNGLSKIIFARPRPYTYGLARRDDPERLDRNVSFYSGHASTAFVSAVAGSLLFSEGTPNKASRLVAWGSQFALAGAAANLRVIAGKHYYSDVVVGALVGSALGIGVPLLHGARYEPRPSEYAVAAGGLALGALFTSALPLESEALRHAKVEWQLSPWATPSGAGVGASGRF